MKRRRGLVIFLLLQVSFAVAGGRVLAQPAVGPVLQGYLAQGSGDLEVALSAFREAIRLDPESAEARTLAAQILASGRKFTDALEVIEEGLGKRPDLPVLLLWRARLLDALGRREEAAETAQKAAEKGGGNDAFSLALRLLQSLGRAEAATAVASDWAGRSPQNPEPQFALAQLLLRNGDKAGARAALERALVLAPDHLPSLRALAEVQEEEGNVDAAEALYRRVIANNPHDMDSRFRLGQLLVKKGKTDEAIQLFKDAERWNGSDRGASLRLAMLLLQGSRPAEAEEILRKIAETQPDDGAVWYLLGASLQAQDKQEQALEAFSRVPAQTSEYPDALVRRALSLRKLKRTDEAVSLLRQWLETHPGDEEVTLALADFLSDQGDHRAGVDLLEGFLARGGAPSAEIYFSLGVLYDKLKDGERSAENMKRSLGLNPDDPHTLNYLGYSYAERGVNLEEAERLVVRALELKPNDGAITDSLGWVYYKQKRYSEAVGQLRRAVELSPKDAVIWEHLGDALKALGDNTGAREAYGKAGELDPASASAKEKLEATP